MFITYKDIKAAEKLLSLSGKSYWEMVEDAGISIALFMREQLNIQDKNILFLCGKGNNGADAIVAASKISSICNVSIYFIDGEFKTKEGETALAQMPLSVKVLENIDEAVFENADIIVDGIYGIGFKGKLPEKLNPLCQMYNNSQAYKVAIDIPSGVECDTGKYSTFFKPNMTIVLSKKKPAHCVNWANYSCGTIHVIENKVSEVIEDNNFGTQLIDKSNVKIPKHFPWSNKGNNGKLALICGSEQYIGAALLACHSALRTGVGYIYLFSVPKVCNAVNIAYPEVVCIPMKENEFGSIDKSNIKTIFEKTTNCTAIALGCGMGDNIHTQLIVRSIINRSKVPVIIDADGLNSIKDKVNILQNQRNCHILITPHIGEFKRLTKSYVSQNKKSLEDICKEFVKETDVILVLKDFITKIYNNDENIWHFGGNNALAKAGSGDILTGIISGFVAQNIGLVDAVKLALYLQGKTTELLSETNHKLYILPSDMPYYFGRVLKELEEE